MTENTLINNLLLQADRDYQLIEDLYKKKSYTYSLFFGQLAIEKILKALIVKKQNKIYPPIHSLTKLATIADIPISEIRRKELDEITSYNISARYDDIKLTFFNKATKNYSDKWLNKIKEIRKWLLTQF